MVRGFAFSFGARCLRACSFCAGALAVALATGATTPAYAEDLEKTLYLGAGVNQVRVSFDDAEYENYVRDRFQGVNLYFGKRLSDRTAIEFGYLRLKNSGQSVTTSADSQTPFKLFGTEGVAPPQTTATTKATVQGVHVDVVRFLPINRSEALVSLGALRLKSKVSAETDKAIATKSGTTRRIDKEKSFFAMRLGGGLQWQLTPSAHLRGVLHYYPVDRFQDIIGSAWSGTISLNFSF